MYWMFADIQARIIIELETFRAYVITDLLTNSINQVVCES